MVNPLIILGISYSTLDMLDSSLICMNQAYEIAIEYNRPTTMGIIHNNLGELYGELQQDEMAKEYLRRGLKLGLSTDYVEVICASSIGLAALFKQEGESDSALYYSRMSINTGRDGGFPIGILEASIFLSSYFKDLNMFDSAYFYQELTIAAKDSLFSQEKVSAMQNLGFLEKIRQQEMEEARMVAKAKRKSNIQMLGVATFISFFFVLLFLISKRKVKPSVVEYMGLIGLLLLFEFIALLVGEYVEKFTGENQLFILLALVLLASLLVPLHNKLQHLIKVKLVNGN